ncbi:MAG: 16S rRNA (guanine(966)-N(2))-methyltransferase RsmD [Pseudomonadota bacterium]|uniref:16S rRNA (Guanine(966)-N(2))-methyltransferase RsmD n=1 Tax=Candidatus Desulfatibia profunda TaxID=2841695 RepID=A0A8J6TMH5_9BACT|nr:16S rRNA (guanine(966)-N(2))-methyltransferase RsmD [Candidatus Desulfatibia profunda]MBL7179494.1 16S rRNA (guanine(966)-N(2))-methyltransferase RsmD [Desulfobacterales bacterium]
MGLRIIGGSLRGKKLHAVRGIMVRPTADRLRESLFNIISARVQEAVVLDLFAGTGALGIEAISRGAESAVFIDNHQQALSAITLNIKSCAFGERTKIIKWDISKSLNCIKSSIPAFNLVFMDPPYGQNIIKPALFNLYRSNSLERGAYIVIEHTASEPIPADLGQFEIDDQRKYGKTLVSFLNYVV